MSDVQLGLLAPDGADRDATHVATVPAIAATSMQPGAHCGVLEDGRATSANIVQHIGIVDPFLRHPVNAGERFFLCLYPRTVTGLRHVYFHHVLDSIPATTLNSNKEASERWLRSYIARADCPDYDTVINAAIGDHAKNTDPDEPGYMNSKFQDYGEGKSYLYFGGRDAHGEIPAEFWDHVEIVSGRKITQRATHFACSC